MDGVPAQDHRFNWAGVANKMPRGCPSNFLSDLFKVGGQILGNLNGVFRECSPSSWISAQAVHSPPPSPIDCATDTVSRFPRSPCRYEGRKSLDVRPYDGRRNQGSPSGEKRLLYLLSDCRKTTWLGTLLPPSTPPLLTALSTAFFYQLH